VIRYTINDLFQLKQGTGIVAGIYYGAALVGTFTAAYTLWTLS